jgi:hypothetical protein
MARYTPEMLASLKRAYEDTDEPMRLIADRHEIGITTLQTLATREGWAKRSQRMRDRPASALVFEQSEPPLAPSPPLPLPPAGQAVNAGSGSDEIAAAPLPEAPAEAQPPRSPAARLEALILKRIAAEEARADSYMLRHGAADRCARTLVILGQALTVVQKLRAAEPSAEDDDPVPSDVDEYRLELARRIRAFVEARQAAAEGEPAAEQ